MKGSSAPRRWLNARGGRPAGGPFALPQRPGILDQAGSHDKRAAGAGAIPSCRNPARSEHQIMSVVQPPPRLIVGISGASGAIYGIRLLRLLRDTPIETHLVLSQAARITLAHETDLKLAEIEALASVVHPNTDIGAACASGSFRTLGMVVAPCSVKTLSEIATGVTPNLLSRAADVVLKERRRLVLLLRETPLHLGHIRSMAAVTEAGAIVYPPVPAFYARPASLEEMVDHTLGRVLDLFDISLDTVRRWTGQRTRPGKGVPNAAIAPP
jgi:flavin prenyltransferase